MPRRTTPAPAKKTSASRTTARPAATAKKAAPARKAAAPAPKTTTRRAPAAKPAQAAPKAAVAKTPPVQAHDVARAQRDLMEAQARLEAITKAYFAEHGLIIQGAVDHVAAIAELDGPVRQGATKHDGPQQKALARDPQVGEYYDIDAVQKMTLTELRELARDLASRDVITETTKKTAILKEMEEAGLFRKDESASSDEDDLEGDDTEDAPGDGEEEGDFDDDEDDESDEDDEDVEDDDTPTLEEIEDAKLSQLREWCEEYEIRTAKKSADDLREALIEKLELDEGDDEPEDDEESGEDEYDDEGDDGEEEEEDNGGGYLTVAEAKKMTLEELQQTAKTSGEKVPAATFKDLKKLRAWIIEYIESAEDDEEEDEDE